ncbi:MAG: HutD family protein [Oscillospiraceae bacterium]|nr:HutD family protein [Oscillospiraceae bacterium]
MNAEDSVLHRKPSDYTVSRWAGGTTTQMAISPPEAVYADRSFLWRISSATVDVKESTFTSLPDYERWICPLQGEMCLRHGGGAEVRLAPFALHVFHGGDETTSRGCCTDFNLMLRRDLADGKAEHLETGTDLLVWTPDERAREILVYCVSGRCTAEASGGFYELGERESLLIRGNRSVGFSGAEPAHLMICQMWTLC